MGWVFGSNVCLGFVDIEKEYDIKIQEIWNVLNTADIHNP
jgi:hypothetical protein